MRFIKINFKRGSGSSLGFLFSAIVFIFLFIFLCNMYLVCLTKEQISDAMMRVGHDIVTCKNIKQARVLAQDEMVYYLSGNNQIYSSHITTGVDFEISKGREWKKGNYIYLTLSVKYNQMGFIPTIREYSNLLMIERNESS